MIIATDVGQNQLWAAQYLELNDKKKMLTSGGLGTMGYGLPAAVGARIGNPDTRVVLITGDGGLQMNIQEMATAVAYELPLIICVLNNGYLGNVRPVSYTHLDVYKRQGKCWWLMMTNYYVRQP